RPAELQSQPRDRGHSPHHVRPADHALGAGGARGPRLLRQAGLRERHSPQRAAFGVSELRQADPPLRHRLCGRPGLPGPGPGVSGARRRAPLGRRGLREGAPMESRTGGTRDRAQNRLGRGISALLPQAGAAASRPSGQAVASIPIEDILPDRNQPRRHFDEAQIEELAASIRSKGVIQPILVRKDGEKYRIIAGERRWRAAQRAGLRTLPALVKEVTERQAFELALIENIQRADLNPIEEAEAYRRLIEEFGLTQEGCAERVGKERSSIANSLRLLRLPEEVKERLIDG